MKSNPLFVDSTRFRGEMITAEIEVIGVELRDGESLMTKVIQRDGRGLGIQLEHKMGLRYVGSVRLAYQESLTIKHCVMNGDDVVEETPEKKFTVNYTNLQRWDRLLPKEKSEATLDEVAEVEIEDPQTATSATDITDTTEATEATDAAGSLVSGKRNT